MTDFRQTIQNRLHQRFAVDATYAPVVGEPIPVKVKLRVGVAIYGEDMEFIGNEDQLVFLLSDIEDASKKDIFVVTVKGVEQQYQLIKPLQNDGIRAIWSIRCVD